MKHKILCLLISITLLLVGCVDEDGNLQTSPTINVNGVGFDDITRLYNTNNVTIPSSSYTQIPFNSEYYDLNNNHSTISSNGTITFTDSGYYIFGCQIAWDINDTGIRILRLKHNSYEISKQLLPASGTAGYTYYQTITNTDYFSANDTLTAEVYQTTAGDLKIISLETSRPYSPVLWLARIN